MDEKTNDTINFSKVLPNPKDYTFNWKSRKLWIAIILFIFSTVLFVTQVVDVDYGNWANFIKWTFAIYMAGNAVAKGAIDGISNWKSKKVWGVFTIFATATVFLFTGKLIFIEWAHLIQWCFGIYTAANISSKYANTYLPMGGYSNWGTGSGGWNEDQSPNTIKSLEGLDIYNSEIIKHYHDGEFSKFGSRGPLIAIYDWAETSGFVLADDLDLEKYIRNQEWS